jgi:hypothetical protein
VLYYDWCTRISVTFLYFGAVKEKCFRAFVFCLDCSFESMSKDHCLLCVSVVTSTGMPELQAYCQRETFEASCPERQVVQITQATYGRMRLSRCVAVDMGYVGCSADALPVLTSICSGQQQCTVHVPDDSLDALRPCLELKSYLEVAYRCIPEEGRCFAYITSDNAGKTSLQAVFEMVRRVS